MNATIPVKAEWLKLRSVRSTWWFAGGALVTMTVVASLEADDLRARGGGPGSVEAASSAMTAVGWLHFILGSLGLLAITSEYATRSIMVTLACTPSRTRLLLAKTAVVGAAVFVAGVLIAALAVAGSTLVLGEYARFDIGRVAGQILGMGVDLALIAVLALGLGTLIRRSAGTLAVLFVLLMVLPSVLTQFAQSLQAPSLVTITQYLPAAAGDRLIAGEPAFGLVLAAWAAGAVAAGVWALRARDA